MSLANIRCLLAKVIILSLLQFLPLRQNDWVRRKEATDFVNVRLEFSTSYSDGVYYILINWEFSY